MEISVSGYLDGIDPVTVKMTPELMINLIGAMTNDAPAEKDSRAKAKRIFTSLIWGAKKDGRALEFFSVMQGLNGKTNKSTGKDIILDAVAMMQIDHPLTIALYNALQENISYFGKEGDSAKLKELGGRIAACKLLTEHQKTVLLGEISEQADLLGLKAKAKEGARQVTATARKAEDIISGIKDGTITKYDAAHKAILQRAILRSPDAAFLRKLVNSLSGLPAPMHVVAKNKLNRLEKMQARTQTGIKH